jgi:NAD-dependent SIR2 family protein deacetylase
MSSSTDEFVRHYSRAVRSGEAALFIGAGMSRSAGFVDWRGLLREIAMDMNLDIDRESDLIAVAQYHVNRKRTRSHLHEAILHEFTKTAQISENHRILARLPISFIWTTNYDTLLEDSIKAAGKTPDVKLTHENLAQIRPGRDVIIYKMQCSLRMITNDTRQPIDSL